MTSKDDRAANMKITSWNVDGLRAWVKKNGLDVRDHMHSCTQHLKCPYNANFKVHNFVFESPAIEFHASKVKKHLNFFLLKFFFVAFSSQGFSLSKPLLSESSLKGTLF